MLFVLSTWEDNGLGWELLFLPERKKVGSTTMHSTIARAKLESLSCTFLGNGLAWDYSSETSVHKARR